MRVRLAPGVRRLLPAVRRRGVIGKRTRLKLGLMLVRIQPTTLLWTMGIVYLGRSTGILEDGWEKRFEERTRHHQKTVLRGHESVEYGDEELFPEGDIDAMSGLDGD